MKKYRGEFTPIELSQALNVTNKTVINRLAVLVKSGLVTPILVKERIRSYKLSDFAKKNVEPILEAIDGCVSL